MKTIGTTEQCRDGQGRQWKQAVGALVVALLAATAGSGCGPQATREQGGNDASAPARADAPKGAGDAKAAANPAANPMVGTYQLVSVDGKKVPCTISPEGQPMTIQAGTLALNPDGTCVSRIDLRGEDGTAEVKASYTQDGRNLAMKWEDGSTATATSDGKTLTMKNQGMTLSYRK